MTFSIRATWSLALLMLCAAMYPLERSGWTENWVTTSQVLALMLTVGWLRSFFSSAQGVVLTSFFQIYSIIGLMVSALIISSGAYMIEVARFGTANGFFWVLMGYLIGGLEASRTGWNAAGRVRWGNGPQRPSDGLNKLVVGVLVGITLLLSAYVMIRTGGPVLLDVDRVTFWRTMAPPGTTIVPSLVGQSIFFAIFYYMWMRSARRPTGIGVLILLAYVLIAIFVLGEKFSMFIIFGNAAALIAPSFFPKIRIRTRVIIASLAMLSSLVGFTAFSYIAQGRDMDFVLVRAALQSQLMWSVFDEPRAVTLWPTHAVCYFGCEPFKTGRDFISFRYLPSTLFYRYEDINNSVSGFVPALSILSFGIILSAILHLAVAFLLGFLQRKLVVALRRPDIIYGFLLFKLHYGLFFLWYSSTFTPLRGMVATAILMLVYRLMLPRPGPTASEV